MNLIGFALILSLSGTRLWAAEVTLAWDANSEDLGGYRLYYGVSPGYYDGYLDVIDQVEVTVQGLEDEVTYYFAATAYDLVGNESGYSNEAVYTPPPPCTYLITPITLSFDGAGGTGVVSLSTSSSCSWTAVSNVSWISITSSSSGKGGDAVNFSVAANTESSPRTGTLTVANETLTVTQAGIEQYRLTVTTSGTGTGTVTTNPSGPLIDAGTVVTLTATPDVSSAFTGWSDGVSGPSPTVSLAMSGDTTVIAAFTLKTYTITATAGPNGSISPQGNVTVNYGASQSFTVAPTACYEVTNVMIDLVSVGEVTTYTFNNVTADHSIQASFTLVPPEAATLVSPWGKITDTTPTYTWNAVPGATKYYLFVNDATGSRIRTSFTATQAECASGTGTCSITPSTVLTLGTVKWWIQTWNTAGYGPWSTPTYFALSRR